MNFITAVLTLISTIYTLSGQFLKDYKKGIFTKNNDDLLSLESLVSDMNPAIRSIATIRNEEATYKKFFGKNLNGRMRKLYEIFYLEMQEFMTLNDINYISTYLKPNKTTTKLIIDISYKKYKHNAKVFKISFITLLITSFLFIVFITDFQNLIINIKFNPIMVWLICTLSWVISARFMLISDKARSAWYFKNIHENL